MSKAIGAEHRLAAYGTLRPGESNHQQLASLVGRWTPGTLRGHRFESGWGEWVGYPGVVLDPDGPLVEVEVFTSLDLVDHWHRLDAFEGAAYRRVVVTVDLGPVGEFVDATVYEVLLDEPGAS